MVNDEWEEPQLVINHEERNYLFQEISGPIGRVQLPK